MADLVNQMLDRFMALSQEEKQISAEMDAAFKEYNDYCGSSDEDLNEKTDEIREKMKKLDYLLEYAKEHAQPDGLEEAPAPFETSAGQLESIRQTIKLDSHNDPNAETLYTKVTGQIKFYEQKIEQTKQLIEGSKVQAKRQYDSDVAALTNRKQQHDEKVKAYIQSDDFREYLKLLTFDKSAFNSPGTVELPSNDFVSLGQRRVKLSVPMEVETELSSVTNGEYNAAARTIGAPYRVPTDKGGVLFLDYDERNLTYLLGGVQRLLLNMIKYHGHDITDMMFCDPSTFGADALGHISALGKGANAFITVPQSLSDAGVKLGGFAEAVKSSPTPDKVSRVLVLNGFPENYMDDMLETAVSVCRAARQSGVLVVLIHGSSADETPVEKEVRALATSVRSRNGGFWIEDSRESLFWYSAPSDIPEEIRRVYVEQRRQQAAQAEREHAPEAAAQPAVQPEPVPVSVPEPEKPKAPEPAEQPVEHIEQAAHIPEHVPEPAKPEPKPAAEAPKPEPKPASRPAPKPAASVGKRKGSRMLPEIKIGMSVDSNPVNMDIGGGITFICGKRGGDREMLTDRIITQIIERAHPDDAELWLYDCGGELKKHSERPAAHIRYAVSDFDGETAFDFIDVISAEFEKRTVEMNKNGWDGYSAVPENVYMPRVFVVINEFSRLLEILNGAPRYFGRSFTVKLAGIFRKCADCGMHFVLTSEAFLENGKRPACFENVSVHCAAAVAGCDSGVREMFGHIKLYENEIESLKKVPEGCAFTAAEGNEEGLIMVRMLAAQAVLDNRFIAVSEYRTGYDEYVGKHPLLADRKLRAAHRDRAAAQNELIAAKAADETLLFLGEPCRFRAEYPIHLYEEFGENVLAVAPEREKASAALMVRAALRSLAAQGRSAEVLTWRGDPVYAELAKDGIPDGVSVLTGEEAVARVKAISADAAAGKRASAFEIVLGGDHLLAAMHAEDCLGDMKRALVKGSRLGAHFMFVSGSAAQLATGFISLFRHRLVFACPFVEAEKLLRDPGCELPANAFRLSDDYDELTLITYLA
ncbi:MAG: hypothetical protein NC299_04835 [Lachnospiraceae bacterium]|nr:hypothetical protein [Ruminococcus sp.]MCM1274675.1 hypothetical protein [Lachnospiraceae bacterium]